MLVSFLILIAVSRINLVIGLLETGKVKLIKDGTPVDLLTKQCKSGVYLAKSTAFNCICVTGVWAFYSKFCEEPIMIVGGSPYCFKADDQKFRHAAIVGSHAKPFISSITHFVDEKFNLITETFTNRDFIGDTQFDATGAWITITNAPWTLHNDDGTLSICLKPYKEVEDLKNMFCKFSKNLAVELAKEKWTLVTKLVPGCLPNIKVVFADACYPIRWTDVAKGMEVESQECKIPPNLAQCPENPVSPTDPDCIPKSTRSPLDARATTNKTGYPGYFRLPKSGSLDSLSGRSSLGGGASEMKCEGLTRKSVADYWAEPGSYECAKSISEAMFTDQLRRFAVTRFNTIFESRIQSLEQMSQLLHHSKNILKKTCGWEYVPPEFLDLAVDAFLMFVYEDFFYGSHSIDPDSFDRITKSLKKCWGRAKLFIFESEALSCDLRRILPILILPEKKANLTIPPHGKSAHFEILIEVAWKVFLHAHSYCFEDFVMNDHHLFSVRVMTLFNKSIYQKWIEPLRNKGLYKFILPYYEFMKEIMENVDNCVAAAAEVSQCPTWLQRSSPSTTRNEMISKDENRAGRTKRGTAWQTRRDLARSDADWKGGMGFCLQRMQEPMSKLHLAVCQQVYH